MTEDATSQDDLATEVRVLWRQWHSVTVFLSILVLATLIRWGLTPVERSVDPTPAVTYAVDINSATIADLTILPGVGEKLAKQIIEYRTQHGPFSQLSELQRVVGLGPRKVDGMAAFILFSKPAPPAPGFTLRNSK